MRSEQIHIAIAQGNTRFEICSLVSKGLKITHRRGVRFEESIGAVLGMLSRRSGDHGCSPEGKLRLDAQRPAIVRSAPCN